MGLQIRNARATKVRVITTLIAVFALVAQPLAGFVSSQVADAAPMSIPRSSAGFNSLGWAKDRTQPFAYSKTADKLAFTVNNTTTNAPSSATFYKWEGFKSTTALSAHTDTVRASLYIDPSWQNKPVNVSMWGVTSNGTGDAWPMIAFSNGFTGSYDYGTSNFVGFRAYDTNTGVWHNIADASAYWGSTVDLEISVNATTGQYELYINGTKVYEYSTDGYNQLKAVIFNNLNLKSNNSADNYYVKWTNFYTGQLDGVKPVVKLNLNRTRYVNSGASVTSASNPEYEATDANLDYVRLYKADGVTPIGSPATTNTTSRRANLSWLSEGTYIIRAYDKASNVSDAFEFTIDNTAPSVSLVSPANDKYLNGASVTQSWTSSSSDIDHFVYESFHDAAATNVRWSENFGANVTSKTATNVSNATYWWRVTAVDKAGNSTKSELRKITIDNDFPTVAVNANPAEGAHVNGGQVNITGTVNDTNFSYYRYQLLDASKNPVTNSIPGGNAPVMSGVLGTIDLDHMPNQTINAALRGNQLPEGTYYVRVWAQDKATNQTGTKNVPYIATFTLDRTNPDLTVASPTTGWTTEKSQTFSGTTTGDTVEAELDGNPLAVVLNGQQWSADSGVLAVGLHTFVVTTTDTAGNKTSQTVQFEVRNTAPTQGRTLSESPNAPDGPSGFGPNGFTGLLGANNPANNQNDRVAVLGAESQKDAEKDVLGTTATPAVIAPSSEGWKLFGVAWYWWLLVLAVVASLAWWLVGMARRRAEENA